MPISISKSQMIAVLIVVATLSTLLLQQAGLFSRIELASFDHRVSLFRSDLTLHDDIAVVLIDDDSLQNMAAEIGRWPWPRSAYKELLDFFALAGAQALAFDILLIEQEQADGDDRSDQILVEATRAAGNAVHAMNLSNRPPNKAMRPLPDAFNELHAIKSIEYQGPSADDYLIPFEELYKASRDIGYLGLETDRDGVNRRVRLFNQFDGKAVFPALASALVIPLVSGDAPIIFNDDFVRFGDLEVPLGGDGSYLINPVGHLNSYSVGQVFAAMKQIRAGETENLVLDPKEFAGKIIFLGASAAGLLDVKSTALDTQAPGVFLHAYTVSNILQQDFLEPASPWLTGLIVFMLSCLGVIPVVIMPRLLPASLISIVAVIGYLTAAYSAFAWNQVYAISPVIFATAFALLLAYSYRTFSEKEAKQLEEEAKNRVRKMLGQYVSPNVLKEVIDSGEDLRAGGGSTKTLTVLFSDIRGFTNISEVLEAEKVVDLLNTYFSEMTKSVFDYDGTLDKFIGDAVMAFWGAPLMISNHADQALNSAIDMRKRLKLVNEQLVEKSYPPINIGIGLHSGEVILGNIGSEQKLDYTVIGDSVNLASRIEGLTKTYGASLILSEDTYQLLETRRPCLLLDRVRVKGKKKPINLYSPAELFVEELALDIDADALVALVERAFECYLSRNWQEALELYGQIGDCMLSTMFTGRCAHYQENAPDDDWDGVHTFTSK